MKPILIRLWLAGRDLAARLYADGTDPDADRGDVAQSIAWTAGLVVVALAIIGLLNDGLRDVVTDMLDSIRAGTP